LRVAADREGRSGSLFTDLEVPDLEHDHFAVSGLLAGARRQPSDLAGVPAVPVSPTVSRVFHPSEATSVFLRVYQHPRAEPLRVDVRIAIDDNRGIRPVEDTLTLSADQFQAGSADIDYQLPLGRLGAGEHLLTISLTCGKQEATRTMRFVVEKP
jgi:hypothetical protein